MNAKFTIIVCAVVLGLTVARTISSAAESDQGRTYFLRYCGSCHGVEGKGDGPVSRSLKVKPADLTQLQKRNNGVFPLEKVTAAIEGKSRISAHGESQMPVWGEIFQKQAAGRKNPAGASVAKIKIIVDYLATIQR